jgi:hypothetical protein
VQILVDGGIVLAVAVPGEVKSDSYGVFDSSLVTLTIDSVAVAVD